MSNKFQTFTQKVVYGNKYLLIPFYVGLVLVQALYLVKYSVYLWEIVIDFSHFSETDMLMAVLTTVDMVMIANLIKIIASGSWYAFVSKDNAEDMEKISSGYLKVKMSMSLVGISSIHLLQAFLNSAQMSDREVWIRCSIHLVFLVSTLIMAAVEYMHHKSSEHHLSPSNEKEPH